MIKEKATNSEKKFIHVFSNLLIFAMLITMLSLVLSNNLQTVLGTNTNNAIYHGNRNSNKVSLMFNVYWGTEYLNDILNTLNNYNVKTTFFVGGQWAEKEQDMLKLIANNGHEIGNHGYFHKDHNKLSYSQNKEEINVCHTLINTIVNYNMNLFAPPSGAYNKTTLDVASELGYKTIMWSKDTIDWRDKDETLVFSRATKNVSGGDLILMHPTSHTLLALPKILEYYKQNNLIATTVTETIKM